MSEWQPIETAPKDDEIVGKYGNDEVVIQWALRRRCAGYSEGGRIGSFGPGWEQVDVGLIVDPPEAWKPVRATLEVTGAQP